MSAIKLVVGLGNPGRRYLGSRHNLGFTFLDHLCKDPRAWTTKDDAALAKLELEGHEITLFKPMTYMNLSGEPLSRYVNFYKIQAEHILLVYDDLDLMLGKMRLRQGGGDAGHNGVRSVVACLGSPDFLRLRLGIGKPSNLEMDISAWVLAKFETGEIESVNSMLARGREVLLELTKSGLKEAQNKFN